MISGRDIEELRAMMPDLLRERLGITDVRRSFRYPSPSHDDSDPSAHYYGDGHMVHCFGCGKTWDAFALIGELDDVSSFPEQVRALADALGYVLDGGVREGRPRAHPQPRPPFDVPRPAGAQDVFDACGRAFGDLYAPGNEVGRRYLRYRGLDDDDAARWGLGFTGSPKAVMPQFSVYEPEALGFIVIPFFTGPDSGGVNYCMLRTVSRGAVRNKEWRPKGVALPLWNEWMLAAALPVVYVAEGLIDAMALSKFTGKPTMALGGVANAKRFAQVLYYTPADRRPGKVVVCMDNDAEGDKAASRMCLDLAKIGVRHAVLPPYPGGAKDADEWLMAGRGVRWDFEEHGEVRPGVPLYRTRWRHDG